jgi:hypothetical protein
MLKFVWGSTPLGLIGNVSVAGLACLLCAACRAPQAAVAPSIQFTHLPPAGEGNAFVLQTISGRVTGARLGQRIVLFAQAGVWWVQPLGDQPYTAIQPDSTWKNSTHPGMAYAALLVDAAYKPPLTLKTLPQAGGPVSAVAVAEGPMLESEAPGKLRFSGYDWTVRRIPGSPAGLRNEYDPANVRVDARGFLHLRIQKTEQGWTSAEITLTRSLGYGLYRFVVSDVSQLEPQMVLAISSWDGSAQDQEMDIEISRWGEATGRNAQYVVQPYYLAANVVRFLAPAGLLAYSFDWEPGRVAFRTARGEGAGSGADLVSSHVFTSGVPAPGREIIRMNLYVFDNRRFRLDRGTEVIVEKFEYLP